MAVITVPRVLREKLGEDGTDSLVELINKVEEKGKEDVLVFVEEKFEKRLAVEMSKVNERVSETKAEMIRWMFIFWVGQIGVMIGLLFAFFKK